MNEGPYKEEELQAYRGILTNPAHNGNFKMELKVEDNPVLKKSVEKIESSIELQFHYGLSTSTRFFHDIRTCPCRSENKQCHECKEITAIYDKFKENLEQLQIGDTFRITAALINNKQSELPVHIHFKGYERIEAACKSWDRLADTPEGIKKKQEVVDQQLQREREEEKRRKKEEARRKRAEKWHRLEQWFAKYPTIIKVIGLLFLGIPFLIAVLLQLPTIFKFVKDVYRLFVSN